MAGLFDKQAHDYLAARPTYPPHWFSLLAPHTSSHSRAWDIATGNGQAAIAVAEHYQQVIATDVSQAQLKLAKPHPRVRYLHTPLSLSDDELVQLIGGENSVDLVTVAQALHWFHLPRLYSVVNRVLRKPNGVFAVWGYNGLTVTPEIDAAFKRFHDTTIPYWKENVKHLFADYRTLAFPFQDIGLGSEGRPLKLAIPKQRSFEEILGLFRSWTAVVTAKERGVDLLPESVIEQLENVWGGPKVARPVVYKAFMLAGKPHS
ncbi:putative methyltransferase DDB_G0268948 [Cynara cardunculus var. scolymus]|nr:putative methyltransferase DDB_G0268948 [Cynara cardunculus var. scolymus]